MPKYSGLQSVLAASLDKYIEQGFTLQEESDNFIVLYHEGKEILRALQNSPKITAAFLQCECEAHLTMRHGVYV